VGERGRGKKGGNERCHSLLRLVECAPFFDDGPFPQNLLLNSVKGEGRKKKGGRGVGPDKAISQKSNSSIGPPRGSGSLRTLKKKGGKKEKWNAQHSLANSLNPSKLNVFRKRARTND